MNDNRIINYVAFYAWLVIIVCAPNLPEAARIAAIVLAAYHMVMAFYYTVNK